MMSTIQPRLCLDKAVMTLCSKKDVFGFLID